MSWRRSAACAGVGPEPFFPAATGPRFRVIAEDTVRRYCNVCPVVTECASEGEYEHGVWGGRLPIQAAARANGRADTDRARLAAHVNTLHRSGVSSAEIAARLDVTPRTVYRLLRVARNDGFVTDRRDTSTYIDEAS